MRGNSGTPPGKEVRTLAVIGIVAWAAASCSDAATAPETGRIRVLLTDAPSDIIESANVWISRIYLQDTEGPDDGTWESARTVDLFHDTLSPHVFDLLQLRNGIMADLTGPVEVNATTYRSLSLVVDSVHLVLEVGYHFVDGGTEGTFEVPSGSSSGITVQLLGGLLEVDGGSSATIAVDFPVDENFVIRQDPATGDVRSVLFTPVLRQVPASGGGADPD